MELLRTTQQRLIISQHVTSEILDCLGKTQQLLAASRQLIAQSDALLQRSRPLGLGWHRAIDATLKASTVQPDE